MLELYITDKIEERLRGHAHTDRWSNPDKEGFTRTLYDLLCKDQIKHVDVIKFLERKESSPDTCYTAALKLIIRDRETERPINDALVKIYHNKRVIYEVYSNVDGIFFKDGLMAPATYTILVTREGYRAEDARFTYEKCIKIQETIWLTPN